MRKRLAFITVLLAATAIYATQNIFYKVEVSTSPTLAAASDVAPNMIDIWWPTDTSHVTGVLPFKALVNGKTLGDYSMTWSVDGGNPVSMSDSPTDTPHKEASVDVSGWNWKGNGPYVVTFTAKDTDGTVISQKSITIFTGAIGDQAQSTPASASSTASTSSSQSASQTSPVQDTTVSPSTAIPSQIAAAIPAQPAAENITLTNPADGAVLSGTLAFQGSLDNADVSNYKMFWSVDSGTMNEMPTSYSGTPHKEAPVDLSGWKWNSNNAYVLIFTAMDNSGSILARKRIIIHVGTAAEAAAAAQTAPTTPATAPQPALQAATQPVVQATTQALKAAVTGEDATQTVKIAALTVAPQTSTPMNASFYVDPNSNAAKQASSWRSSRPSDATMMDKIASQPVATWLGNWTSDVKGAASQLVSAASSQGKTAVIVAYNIPDRDCGGYSAGGANSPDGYKSWISGLASGIGSGKAIVILEPDALPGMDCLNSADQATRVSLLSFAVSTLKANSGTKVYLDAGNSNWKSADIMAGRLKSAGIDKADGFSLNVSNFYATDELTAFGSKVSGLTGGAHFVIDTSRNGNGSDGAWCNPSGRALGTKPTTSTGNPLIDAYLWLKAPGESDGNCNGGPAAGQWWADYALGLAKNSNN